jgi:hypothetical protein
MDNDRKMSANKYKCTDYMEISAGIFMLMKRETWCISYILWKITNKS